MVSPTAKPLEPYGTPTPEPTWAETPKLPAAGEPKMFRRTWKQTSFSFMILPSTAPWEQHNGTDQEKRKNLTLSPKLEDTGPVIDSLEHHQAQAKRGRLKPKFSWFPETGNPKCNGCFLFVCFCLKQKKLKTPQEPNTKNPETPLIFSRPVLAAGSRLLAEGLVVQLGAALRGRGLRLHFLGVSHQLLQHHHHLAARSFWRLNHSGSPVRSQNRSSALRTLGRVCQLLGAFWLVQGKQANVELRLVRPPF